MYEIYIYDLLQRSAVIAYCPTLVFIRNWVLHLNANWQTKLVQTSMKLLLGVFIKTFLTSAKLLIIDELRSWSPSLSDEREP